MKRDKATSYKLQATSNRRQVVSCQPLATGLQLHTLRSLLKAHVLRLSACGLLLAACSLSSYAQQSNKAVQQGNEAYKNGEYNAAIKDYSKALEVDKKNTVAWFNMGNALQKTMNSEDAARSYDEAIRNAIDDDLRSKAYYNKA